MAEKRRVIRRLAVASAALLPLFCLANAALARAGGGEGFGGGGGDDGGGGGGGHGGGVSLFILIRLVGLWIQFCVYHPLIGLPVTAVVVYFFYSTHRSVLRGFQNNVIRRGEEAMDSNRVAIAAAAMGAADPTFDAQAFCQRVQAAFVKIQNAWSAQDLTTVRPFVSDGIHERFSLQIEEQKALGYRDCMESVEVDSVVLAEVVSDQVFDVATVQISARAKDFRVALADGKRIWGSEHAEPFVEYWSLLRRHGAKNDPTKPGLMEGHCPNCGAAIEMNQSAKCAHCQALLRSGSFDWVLAEITQSSEWRPRRRGPVPGADAIQATDKAFNRLELEDRTSVMFWRKSMTDRLGSLDPLRKIASDEFCGGYQSMLQPQSDGQRYFYGDCAVGSVDLMGILAGADASLDTAVVEVCWEGERMSAGGQGPVITTHQRIQAHTLYVLLRKSGVSSDPGQSTSSAHCPNCGAPITSDVASACSFCGTVLNDFSRGWVLNSILSAASSQGQMLVTQLQGQSPVRAPGSPTMAAPAPAGLLAWAIKSAVADGTVDLDEQHMLESLAAKCGVEPDRVKRMVDMALIGTLDVPSPSDASTARAWLGAIAATAIADGQLQGSEMDLLTATGRRFGFGPADIDQILREQRAKRYADARQHLNTARDLRSGVGGGVG